MLDELITSQARVYKARCKKELNCNDCKIQKFCSKYYHEMRLYEDNLVNLEFYILSEVKKEVMQLLNNIWLGDGKNVW